MGLDVVPLRAEGVVVVNGLTWASRIPRTRLGHSPSFGLWVSLGQRQGAQSPRPRVELFLKRSFLARTEQPPRPIRCSLPVASNCSRPSPIVGFQRGAV